MKSVVKSKPGLLEGMRGLLDLKGVIWLLY